MKVIEDNSLNGWAGRFMKDEPKIEEVIKQEPCSSPMDRESYKVVGHQERFPNYTGDIELSLLLLEKLSNLGKRLDLNHVGHGESLWEVTNDNYKWRSRTRIEVDVCDAIASKAVCLGAYQAIEGEEWASE